MVPCLLKMYWSNMNDGNIDHVDELVKKVEALQRELRGTQEMLFLVLETVGEPVQVPAEVVSGGIKGDKMIEITLDTDNLYWTFRTVNVPSE